MVFFTCNACGESLKKNQVEKHYRQRCRNCEVLTCVDCHKDFPGDSYASHTKCVSEEEKYSAKGWQPKASANKGQRKQESWIETLQAALASSGSDVSPEVRRVLDAVLAHDNVPRKKAKFTNFVRNILRGVRPATIDETWELMESLKQKPGSPSQEEGETNGKGVAVENGSSEAKNGQEATEAAVETQGDEEVDERLGVKMFKGVKVASNGVSRAPPRTEAQNGGSKKKKRKRTASDAGEAEADSEPSNAKKERTDDDTPSGKFVWEAVVESLLRKQDDRAMKVKKLRRKVIAEYLSRYEDTHKTPDQLAAKLDKKLLKNKKFKIVKEVVRLHS